MKKLVALLLALTMSLGLAACGNGPANSSATPTASAAGTESPTPTASGSAGEATTDPNSIRDDMNSADGTYQVAFVTDVGDLKDKSFNQGTYDGVKLFAANNGLSYKYYRPANNSEATDDDRYNAMVAAVEGGAEVVVCAGYLQEAALRRAAMQYPDIPFIFIDGYALDDDTDPNVQGNILTNVAGIAFQEEQAGYFAGYAAVQDGFTKLGFSGGGGGTNAACNRFGYGYLQGINAAAAELGITVDVNFSWLYGADFQASTDLLSMISGWYANGTEVVFACGGAMFNSISAAASANTGYVIGVDVDQSAEGDMVITSAMKGLSDAVQWALGHVYNNTFTQIGGTSTSLGVKDNAVGLPTTDEAWRFETFTVQDYEELYQKLVDGTLVVDPDYENQATTEWSNINLTVIK